MSIEGLGSDGLQKRQLGSDTIPTSQFAKGVEEAIHCSPCAQGDGSGGVQFRHTSLQNYWEKQSTLPAEVMKPSSL